MLFLKSFFLRHLWLCAALQSLNLSWGCTSLSSNPAGTTFSNGLRSSRETEKTKRCSSAEDRPLLLGLAVTLMLQKAAVSSRSWESCACLLGCGRSSFSKTRCFQTIGREHQKTHQTWSYPEKLRIANRAVSSTITTETWLLLETQKIQENLDIVVVSRN